MRALAVLGTVLLAGCESMPVSPPAGSAPLTAVQIVEATQTAGRDGVELVVSPLIDPQVEDLREYARRAQSAGRILATERALQKSLAITPDAPDLLQWQAEVAVLRGEYRQAEALATRSIALGPKSGPLCRRNWTLLKLLRASRGETENVASAAAMLERCTIAPPVRM